MFPWESRPRQTVDDGGVSYRELQQAVFEMEDQKKNCMWHIEEKQTELNETRRELAEVKKEKIRLEVLSHAENTRLRTSLLQAEAKTHELEAKVGALEVQIMELRNQCSENHGTKPHCDTPKFVRLKYQHDFEDSHQDVWSHLPPCAETIREYQGQPHIDKVVLSIKGEQQHELSRCLSAIVGRNLRGYQGDVGILWIHRGPVRRNPAPTLFPNGNARMNKITIFQFLQTESGIDMANIEEVKDWLTCWHV